MSLTVKYVNIHTIGCYGIKTVYFVGSRSWNNLGAEIKAYTFLIQYKIKDWTLNTFAGR